MYHIWLRAAGGSFWKLKPLEAFSEKEHKAGWHQESCIPGLVLPLICCVTLGKSFSVSHLGLLCKRRQ